MPLSKGVEEDAHHILPRALLALRQYNPQIKRFLKERKKERKGNKCVCFYFPTIFKQAPQLEAKRALDLEHLVAHPFPRATVPSCIC